MADLRLGKGVEKITLILGFVGSLIQKVAARFGVVGDPGVVAGDHIMAAKTLGGIQKTGEF